VVVADAGGVLHWLDPATGDFIARAEVGKSVGRNAIITSKGISYKKRVSSAPLVAGGLVLAFTDNGVLSAYSAPMAVAATAAAAPRAGDVGGGAVAAAAVGAAEPGR
jgi:hypothetical protein